MEEEGDDYDQTAEAASDAREDSAAQVRAYKANPRVIWREGETLTDRVRIYQLSNIRTLDALYTELVSRNDAVEQGDLSPNALGRWMRAVAAFVSVGAEYTTYSRYLGGAHGAWWTTKLAIGRPEDRVALLEWFGNSGRATIAQETAMRNLADTRDKARVNHIHKHITSLVRQHFGTLPADGATPDYATPNESSLTQLHGILFPLMRSMATTLANLRATPEPGPAATDELLREWIQTLRCMDQVVNDFWVVQWGNQQGIDAKGIGCFLANNLHISEDKTLRIVTSPLYARIIGSVGETTPYEDKFNYTYVRPKEKMQPATKPSGFQNARPQPAPPAPTAQGANSSEEWIVTKFRYVSMKTRMEIMGQAHAAVLAYLKVDASASAQAWSAPHELGVDPARDAYADKLFVAYYAVKERVAAQLPSPEKIGTALGVARIWGEKFPQPASAEGIVKTLEAQEDSSRWYARLLWAARENIPATDRVDSSTLKRNAESDGDGDGDGATNLARKAYDLIHEYKTTIRISFPEGRVPPGQLGRALYDEVVAGQHIDAPIEWEDVEAMVFAFVARADEDGRGEVEDEMSLAALAAKKADEEAEEGEKLIKRGVDAWPGSVILAIDRRYRDAEKALLDLRDSMKSIPERTRIIREMRDQNTADGKTPSPKDLKLVSLAPFQLENGKFTLAQLNAIERIIRTNGEELAALPAKIEAAKHDLRRAEAVFADLLTIAPGATKGQKAFAPKERIKELVGATDATLRGLVGPDKTLVVKLQADANRYATLRIRISPDTLGKRLWDWKSEQIKTSGEKRTFKQLVAMFVTELYTERENRNARQYAERSDGAKARAEAAKAANQAMFASVQAAQTAVRDNFRPSAMPYNPRTNGELYEVEASTAHARLDRVVTAHDFTPKLKTEQSTPLAVAAAASDVLLFPPLSTVDTDDRSANDLLASLEALLRESTRAQK